ncbi:MAG: hypothetical protein L3I99_07560 [Sulfurimonas sp.]|nr:hypothetical protein [Sulfurimonas sp.]
MKKFIILLISLLTSLNLFAAQPTLIPFIGSASYEDKNKEADFQFGIYANIKSEQNNRNTYELAYEHKNTTYSTTQSDTSQNDFTFLYTFDASATLKFRGAIHYILSSLKKHNNTLIALAGIEKHKNKTIYGINISQSKYNDNSLTNYIHQLSPYFGIFFGEKNSIMGNFYARINYDTIYPNGKNQILKDVYSSFTISFTQNKGKMENTFRYWTGEQLYAVRNNGLTVYNLDDIHSGGFLISTKYKFSKNYIGQFSYISEDYKSYGTNTNSNMNRFLLSTTFNY